jgi:hypothetical protein
VSHGFIYLSRASLSYRNTAWDTRQRGQTSVAKASTPPDVARNTVDNDGTRAGRHRFRGHNRLQSTAQLHRKPPPRHCALRCLSDNCTHRRFCAICVQNIGVIPHGYGGSSQHNLRCSAGDQMPCAGLHVAPSRCDRVAFPPAPRVAVGVA